MRVALLVPFVTVASREFEPELRAEDKTLMIGVVCPVETLFNFQLKVQPESLGMATNEVEVLPVAETKEVRPDGELELIEQLLFTVTLQLQLAVSLPS